MYSIEDLLKEIAPFLSLTVAIMVLSTVLKFIKDIAKECHIADMKKEIKKSEKEPIKEQEKINIDKDLQKYFNYKK